MRNFKKFCALAAAVFALSAISAVNASAVTFTASATGNLVGSATQTQVFTTNAGQIKCSTAEVSGEIKSTASTEQRLTVIHKNCIAFGFATVHISPEDYLFTGNGTVHIENTITINVTGAKCHQTIAPQTVGTVSYVAQGFTGTIVEPNVKNISYTSTGGLCSTGGLNGTYTGNIAITRQGGGSFVPDTP
ncbi:MAG TPA: hypothetical protein VJU14_06185 [Solirubrobacterales bacterium]|nr:hypothetical protein [Solirubrobacterales bacterium]